MFNIFLPKYVLFIRYVGKYGIGREATDGNRIRRLRFVCGIIKVTDTHSEYVILIAFRQQKCLRERTLVLHCTYIACHFIFKALQLFLP